MPEQLGGEILVCDSTQVYRHFDIGTAKVPLAEQRGIPHHLVDLVEPDEVFTAGEYRRRALDALENVRRRGKLPILTAGTGLYLRALLEGLADAPDRSEELRDRLREKVRAARSGASAPLARRLDREAAGRIAPRDTQKIIRAIEMRMLAGKASRRDSSQRQERPRRLHRNEDRPLAPARPPLRQNRCARERDDSPPAGSMKSAGSSTWACPRTRSRFSSSATRICATRLPTAARPLKWLEQIQQATRRFAKRQITWFRKEPNVHWLAGFGDDPDVIAAALQFARFSSG